MRILVLDIGGTAVKLATTGRDGRVRIPTGPAFGPRELAAEVRRVTAGWAFDVVSIGYPGPVRDGAPIRDPRNLAPGWVGFDFAGALGRPVRLVNDAAMQALGSYEGGHMLFLGLGTGLGSALVSDWRVWPLELAHLPYRSGRTFEDFVGARGLARLGQRRWRHHVAQVVRMLLEAMTADYAVLGGGNARRLGTALPPHTRLGHNALAIDGGFRLWMEAPPVPPAPTGAAGAIPPPPPAPPGGS